MRSEKVLPTPDPTQPRRLFGTRSSQSREHVDPTIALNKQLQEQKVEAERKVKDAITEAGIAKDKAEKAQGQAQEQAQAAVVAADNRVKDAQNERELVQQRLATAERDLAVQRERTGALERERATSQITSSVELARLQEQLRNAEENRRRVQRETQLEQDKVATERGGDQAKLAKLEAERDAANAQVQDLKQQLRLGDVELKGVRQGAEIQRTLSTGQLSQLQEQLRNARDESRALERRGI